MWQRVGGGRKVSWGPFHSPQTQRTPTIPLQGVRYLHQRHFPHGRLKSRNCVVDGRFVLKVTDHGYVALLDTQRAPCPRPAPEGQLRVGRGLPVGSEASVCEAGDPSSMVCGVTLS